MPFINNTLKNPHRFFHDRDTTHTSAYTENWLDNQNITWEYCPVRSPDLNAIEYVWNTLEKRVMDHNPTTEAELEKWIKKEWEGIDQELINNTIEHVRHNVQKVITAEGDNKY